MRTWFGGNSQRVPVPSWGTGATKLGFLVYPTYRLQLIGIIAALLVGLYLVLYRTSVGLVVRAGIENAGMVGILGIDVRRTFLFVFAVGIVAVGLAGMLYAPVVAVTPDMGASFMVQSFVVIVLGGLGSFPRRHRRRPDRRRNHQPDQCLQLRLFGGDALRPDGPRPGGAAARAVRHGGPGLMGVRPLQRAWPELALLVVLLTAPILLPPLGFSHDLLSRALNWVLFGLGLDILFGLAGLLSFGQAAF